MRWAGRVVRIYGSESQKEMDNWKDQDVGGRKSCDYCKQEQIDIDSVDNIYVLQEKTYIGLV
jgi:hypothetical protein